MNNKAKDLNEKIKKIPEVEMYLKLKQEIQNNQELLDLYENIHKLQLKLKDLTKNDMQQYKVVQNELEEKKTIFMNHPTIVNYYYYKNETLNIIEQINLILK